MNTLDSLLSPNLSAPPSPARGRTILFLVPYKARDLEGAALVAYHLERTFGHHVVFSNGYGVDEKILQIAPDAVVMDHLQWDFKARQARLAKQLGMKLIVLPTEGLHHDKEEGAERAGKPFGVAGLVDAHFVWGDFVRNTMLEQNLSPPDRVHTIGCPRFDFYSEPYLSLLPARADFLGRLGIRNPDAPMILWATNTTYAARNQKSILRRHTSRGKLSKTKIWELLQDENVQFSETSKLVLELARRHPEWNFVIKVHPAEWINPYVDLVRESANLYLAFDAPIREFLFHCDALLQRGCTTAAEAWMLGKPVLEVEVGRYHHHPSEEYRRGCTLVESMEAADLALTSSLGGAPIPEDQIEARNAFLTEFCFRNDGLASWRCAEIVNQMLTPPSFTEEDHHAIQRTTAAAQTRWQRRQNSRLSNRIKRTFGLPRNRSLRFWRKYLRREQKDNLSLFVAETEITPSMLAPLHEQFSRVHAASRP